MQQHDKDPDKSSQSINWQTFKGRIHWQRCRKTTNIATFLFNTKCFYRVLVRTCLLFLHNKKIKKTFNLPINQ